MRVVGIVLYDDFVGAVKRQDVRNIFAEPANVNDSIPVCLKAFYDKYEPLDVEVVLHDLSAIRFYPQQSLDALQNEYHLEPGYYVFATREGDPLVIYGQKVLTCSHGTRNLEFTEVASSFDVFLGKIYNQIK